MYILVYLRNIKLTFNLNLYVYLIHVNYQIDITKFYENLFANNSLL